MVRAKEAAPAKAEARSSDHAKAFRKVIAPVMSKGSNGSGTSSSLHSETETSGSGEETDEDSSGSETGTAGDATGPESTASAADNGSDDRDPSSNPDDGASGTEEGVDDSSSSSCETDDSEDSSDTESTASSAADCDDGCTVACLAETARLRKDAKYYFSGCELDQPFALRWAHLPKIPASSGQHWSRNKQRIEWRTGIKEFRIRARLGDTRLEYLVPSVLGGVYKRDNLPRVAVCYLQSNKVLGAIAFAYGFHKNGDARAPHKQLHHYADMLEAFIENVFDDDPSAGTEWPNALWSSRCFPDLQSYIKEHNRKKGVSYQYSDLSRARAWWQKKRKRALSTKPA